MSGLEGIRVLELGQMVSAAYTTKLLADLGADVIKVEEPQGDLARQRGPFPGGVPDLEKSGLFLALNTNKRSVTIDLAGVQGQEQLRTLVQWADILVHNYSPASMRKLEINYDTFHQLNPDLVMCSMTRFGLTGPYKDYNAYEITSAHGGGWAWLSPTGSDQPDQPPLKAFGQQADFQAGLAAATATLAAYHRASTTGVGEHIDLSAQEFVASFLEQNLIYYTYQGRRASRLGQRLTCPWGMYECQDGLMFLVIIEPDQWQRLLELMDNPEWGTWEVFKDVVSRGQNADVLTPFLQEWINPWKVDDLFHEGQKLRICFAPVLTMAQLAEQNHLRARHFFVDVTHPKAGTLTHLGPPYQLREPWWQIRRPAPLLGEHNAEAASCQLPVASAQTPDAGRRTSETRLPLEGIRVVDFSWAWAGPFCTMNLAHLGAEVIKVESQARLDIARRLPFGPKDQPMTVNTSGYFNQWAQGKKSVALNLSTPEGRDIARKLIKESDVVLDNFAAGVMEELGLGYDDLKKIKPDIIMASICGYGHTGPQKDYMAYGPTTAPLIGLSSLTGYPGGGPQEVGISYGDPNAGINAALAICAALVARQRTGTGQYIDISLWEAAAVLIPEGWMDYAMNKTQPPRMGNHDQWMAPYSCFRCAGEDAWVTIACGSDEEWQSLCRAIGNPALGADARFRTSAERKAHEEELEQILNAWTATRDRWEVTCILQDAGVAAFPSMSSQDLVEDRHLNERGFFERLPHPEVGVRTHTGIPWRLTNSPNGVRSPGPLLGQHTQWMMKELLGYSEQEIAKLIEEKVLY